MIEIMDKTINDFIAVKASGKLTIKDYEDILSLAEERTRQYGKTNWYIEITDFKGWEFDAAVEDLKFDIEHYDDIKRIAMVGDKKWHRWGAVASKLFTRAKVEYFDISEKDKAITWAKAA